MSNRNLLLKVMFAAKDNLSGPLKNIVGMSQSGSEKLAAMKKEARDMGRELRDVQGELKRSTGNVTTLMNRERDLAEGIERANREMERQARLNKVAAQAERMRGKGEELRSSGTGMMMTGAAMAAPGVVAAKQAMTFESAMADVRKVVDFDSPKQFQQMGEDIVDMSTKIPMAAEGLAQIVAAAGRAGIARKELLTFATDAAQMGIAFDTTAEDAGNMMAKWRTAFGLGQNQVRELSDQINALTNTYGGNVGAVAGVVTRIGSLGKVAGLAAPQIAAMGQLMNSVGVEEEVAATGIKNMMLAMTKGEAATKSQSKAFAALGLDAKKVDAVATIKAATLIFAPIGSGKTATGTELPVETIDRSQTDGSGDYSRVDQNDVAGVTAAWHDRKSGTRKTVKVEGKGEGRSKRLRKVYASEADAKQAASAENSRIARAKAKMTLKLAYGRPDLFPERPIKLTGFKEEINARRWIIAECSHSMDGSGGSATSLTLEAIN